MKFLGSFLLTQCKVATMKTKTIGSLIVLLAIVSIAVSVPSAYAAHANEAVVDMAPGSGAPG